MTDSSPSPTIEPSAVAPAQSLHEAETMDPLVVVLFQIVKIILEEEQRAREHTA